MHSGREVVPAAHPGVPLIKAQFVFLVQSLNRHAAGDFVVQVGSIHYVHAAEPRAFGAHDSGIESATEHRARTAELGCLVGEAVSEFQVESRASSEEDG